MSPPRERLLLWNMDCYPRKSLRNDTQLLRLHILRELVAEHAPSLVALQEAPSERRLIEAALGRRYRVVMGLHRLATAFLVDRWRERDAWPAARGRALVTRLDSCDDRSRLWFWNVHVPGDRTQPAARRRFVRRDLLSAFGKARERDPDRFELIAGDFNLEPSDDAMLEGGLDANRSREWVSSRENGHELKYRPLFNPTWQLFGRTRPPYGSYYKTGLDGGPWFLLDQTLMSAALAIPGEEQVRVLDRAGALELLSPRAHKPDRAVGSDHLPLRIEFRARCRLVGRVAKGCTGHGSWLRR